MNSHERNATATAPLPAIGWRYGPLLDHHREALHARGLTDDMIKAAGFYSESRPEALAAVLGWERPAKKLVPAIVIPYPPDASGRNGYCRARPDRPRIRDKKPVKYESPVKQPNRVYVPPGVAPVLANAQSELLVTEGEFKAAVCTQFGFPCVGLTGAYGWKRSKAERLITELEQIAWNGRQVRIVYDSDITVKEDVQCAESRLAAQLKNAGAIVRCARLPDGPPGDDGKPTKLGADDFLAKHGAGAFRKLLDSAQEPTEPDAEVTKKNACGLDPATEAKAFLESGMADGVYRLGFWRGGFYRWSNGRFEEVPALDVRGYLIRDLNQRFTQVSAGVTSNVLDQIRAQSLLPASVESPSWIDDTAGWPPDEVLSTPSGLIHLPSFVEGRDYLRKPTPKFFTSSALDYPFVADAPFPRAWHTFLESLFGEDAESIELLRQWFGLSLLPITNYQKILFINGPKRSGKGTIARILTRLVSATNVCNPTLSSLADRFGLWPLIGKLLAIVSDARLSGRSDQASIVERLLSVSGEDSQTIDRKNQPPWNGKLTTRFVICTNEVPRLNDTSGALASRMLVLQLRQSFYGAEILDLIERLVEELPAILLWAIEGWRSLREQGRFTEPRSSIDVAGELADSGSPISVFIREECRLGPECSIQRDVLYNAYVDWAKRKGRQHIEDDGSFGRGLRAALPNLRDSAPRIGGRQVRHYVGIQLE
jgi:putative DNA primase/helicase